MTTPIHQDVQDYYGKTLKSSDDLQTNACCSPEAVPPHIKRGLANIHEEVLGKYYGCGLVAPQKLAGQQILDLGSGAGRDCYLLAQIVGEQGRIVGVDMTDEQLEVANRHIDYHRQKFGYKNSNVQFLKGNLDQLESVNLDNESFDIIISNCVINLCQNKESVMKNVYSLLKEGGEMYFSDVYADRRIPAELTHDPILYGECLSGALYQKDFERLAHKVGFQDARIVESRELTIGNDKVKAKVGDIKFYSITYRLFKIPQLEDACEDYGQKVRYRGNLPHHPDSFHLDGSHLFEKDKWENVCGNTFLMLQKSRFAECFEFAGNFDQHLGEWKECGTSQKPQQKTGGSCC